MRNAAAVRRPPFLVAAQHVERARLVARVFAQRRVPVRAELRERDGRARARAGADMDPERRRPRPPPWGPCRDAVHQQRRKSPGSSHTSRATARNCSTSSRVRSPPNRRAASCSFSALCSAAGHAVPPRRRGRTGGSRRVPAELAPWRRRAPPSPSFTPRRPAAWSAWAASRGGARARATWASRARRRALVAAPFWGGGGVASDEESRSSACVDDGDSGGAPAAAALCGDGPRKGRPALASSSKSSTCDAMRRGRSPRRERWVRAKRGFATERRRFGESMKRAVGERERQLREDVRRRRDRDFPAGGDAPASASPARTASSGRTHPA